MKRFFSMFLFLLLPVVFLFDLIVFFGTKTNISCLTCEVSNYFRTSSLSITVINQSLLPFMGKK